MEKALAILLLSSFLLGCVSTSEAGATVSPLNGKVELLADDSGFYTLEGVKVSQVQVTPSQSVVFSFKVKTENVYFNGLGFDSQPKAFERLEVLPGEAKTAEVTVSEPFTITSYWPQTDAFKASIEVIMK